MSCDTISVVIPTYNRRHTIRRAVESALRQSWAAVETVVVDDGSGDGTREELRSYTGRIIYEWQRNAGPSAARNRGVALSRGSWVAFLDSDDFWDPRKLERQMAAVVRASAVVPCCLCNTSLVGGGSCHTSAFRVADIRFRAPAVLCHNVTELLLSRFVLFNQGALIRRSSFTGVGGYNESLRLLEDYELALRLSLKGPWLLMQEALASWQPDAGSSLTLSATDIVVMRSLIGILSEFVKCQSLTADLAAAAYRRRRRLERRCWWLQTLSSFAVGHPRLGALARCAFSAVDRVSRKCMPVASVQAIPV